MFKNRARLFGVLPIVLCLVSACTTLPARERGFDTSLCNRGAAYEAGFNDGQEGRAMGSSFLDNCREDLRALGQEGYRAGYDSGWARFQERMKAMQSSQHSQDLPPEAPPAPANTNINNGIQINVGGDRDYGQEHEHRNPKAWFCSVHPFTSHFDSFGATQLEARQLTIQSCIRQFNPMHCEDVACQPNR